MPTICAVSGCNSRAGADGLSFFRFLADPERRKLWDNFIGRQQGNSVLTYYVMITTLDIHVNMCIYWPRGGKAAVVYIYIAP
jgi:hypothetical protein